MSLRKIFYFFILLQLNQSVLSSDIIQLRDSLFKAVEENDDSGVERILKIGRENSLDLANITNDAGESPLQRIIIKAGENPIQIVRLLLEYDANPNVSERNGMPLLSQAISIETIPNVVTILLLNNKKTDINQTDKYGRTPLMIAILQKNKTVTDLLLEKKADVNLVSAPGLTALQIAITNLDLELIEKLIKLGANVNAKNTFVKILIIADTDLRDKIANLIISTKDFDVNVKNDKGETPLILAVKYKDIGIIKKLLEHGANYKLKDNVGKSAYDYTLETDNREAQKIIYDFYDDASKRLIKAAQEGNTDEFNKLIENPNTDINLRDKEGFTHQ